MKYNVQLWVKIEDNTYYEKLDLYQEEAIKLNFSVQDVYIPTETKSSFSRTFRVPNSNTNGLFFKSAFNVNTFDYDATKSVDAYINDGGFQVISGNIRLTSIVRNYQTNNIEYELLFLGETSDFGSSIGPGFLCDLSFPEYNHVTSYNAIQLSWNKQLFNGDVLYPLVEWGYLYNDVPQPTQSTMSDGFSKSFTVNTNPLAQTQLKPTLRIKKIWDKIFSDAGYTYDSTFLNSEFFKNLYYLGDKEARTIFDYEQRLVVNSVGAQYATSITGTNPSSGELRIYPTTESFDYSNSWESGVSSTFVPPVTGLYVFDVTWEGYIGGPGVNGTTRGRIQLRHTGTVMDQSAPLPTSGPYSEQLSATLTAGTKYNFWFTFFNTSGTGRLDLRYSNVTITCSQSPVNVTMNSIFSCDYKKLDFIKSIVDRFKLVFVPSKNRAKHFTIVPWTDWINSGTVRDWSDKMDNAKDTQITPLFYSQKRFISFYDADDTDYLNDSYQKNYKKSYGRLNNDSNIDLIKDQQNITGIFAPTPLAPIANDGDDAAKRFLIPHLAKGLEQNGGSETGKRESIAPKPRMLFYNGKITAPLNWYLINDQGTAVAQTTYPLLSNFFNWPPTAQTYDLNWKNVPPLWDPLAFAAVTGGSPLVGNTGTTTYTTYWSQWYNMIYDPYARLVTAYFKLDFNDILEFNFNDPVWVKDSYYFINSISDYVVGQSNVCKVEMYRSSVIPTFVNLYNSVSLYKSVNGSEPCCGATFNDPIGTYFMDQTTLAASTFLFLDQRGTSPAPGGTYSDGTRKIVVGEGGQITSNTVCSATPCIPPASLFPFSVCGPFTNTCDPCPCAVFTTTIYGKFSNFGGNNRFWANSSGTATAADGWYTINSAPPKYLFRLVSGDLVNANRCDAC